MKVEQRNYAIAGKSLEEIVEQVRLVLSYDGEVSRVLITRGNILAEYIVEDEGPPYGKLPQNPLESLVDVLSAIEMVPVNESNEVDVDALNVIAAALIQARKAMRSGVAWVVSSKDKFQEWLGVKSDVSRLFDLPIYELEPANLPENKLVLLCGRTTVTSPLVSDLALIMEMGE